MQLSEGGPLHNCVYASFNDVINIYGPDLINLWLLSLCSYVGPLAKGTRTTFYSLMNICLCYFVSTRLWYYQIRNAHECPLVNWLSAVVLLRLQTAIYISNVFSAHTLNILTDSLFASANIHMYHIRLPIVDCSCSRLNMCHELYRSLSTSLRLL